MAEFGLEHTLSGERVLVRRRFDHNDGISGGAIGSAREAGVRLWAPSVYERYRRVEHTNSSAVLVRDVARAGSDLTDLVRAAYDRIDEPAG